MEHPFFLISGLTTDEFWEAVYAKYIPVPPALIPDCDEEYHQIEAFTMSSQTETEVRMTTQGQTFDFYT